MRRLSTALGLVLTLLVGSGYAATRPINGVVVIVNDAVITYKDLQQYIGPSLEVIERTYANQPAVLAQKLQEAERNGLDDLVERKLILHEFKTLGYNFPESVIDDQVKKRIRDRFGDRLNATKSLQAEGITYEAFRQHIREDFIIGAMRMKNLQEDIIISPHKIEKYYAENRARFKAEDQVKLRVIVLNQPAGATPGAARKLAQEILAKLDEGAPFAELASIYSEGSQRAQGGDWGWVERSVPRKELAEAAFALKPGAHSGVIDLGDACYLLLVEDARRSHVKTLPEVRDEIDKTLLSEERARLNKAWIERLKAKSFLRYY